jgi:hypothetical protein
VEARTLFVGHDGEKVVDSKTTLEQIAEVENLECSLKHEGEQLSWKLFNNPDEPRTIFQFILGDRKWRVDENTLMADRPPVAVVTAMDNKAVRLEFYEGHDALTCSFDVRAEELQGKDMPLWMTSDPQAYDPIKFLKEAFGLPEDFTRPVMKSLHPDTWDKEHPNESSEEP